MVLEIDLSAALIAADSREGIVSVMGIVIMSVMIGCIKVNSKVFRPERKL